MKKEIRQDVRDYIIKDVNSTLSRLGISEEVKETNTLESRFNGTLHYNFESAPFRQAPVIFKEIVVHGYLVLVEGGEGSLSEFPEYCDAIVINLSYHWKNFGGGSNGCELGRMIYAVYKDIDEKPTEDLEYFIRKYQGLTI